MNHDRPQTGGAQGPTALPPDERLRQNGARLVTAISAMIRVGRSYSAQNQVFQQQVASLLQAIQPSLEEQGEAVLVAVDGHIYLNGMRVPIKANTFKFSQAVVELLTRLRITGMRFDAGVRAEDMTRFFELLLTQDGPTGADLVSACHALVIRGALPVVSAATEPGAAGDPGGVFAAAAAGEGERSAGGGGGDRQPDGGTGPAENLARTRHSQALRGAQLLLMPTSLQSDVAVRHAKRVVQPLVEGVSLSEPIVVGLSTLTEHDEYTYAHAVNVCAVAVSIGHFLELDRRALADLGVAALLHDVGKHTVAGEIRHAYEEWSPFERDLAERHPMEGVKLLARSTTLNPTTYNCMRVALEHHAGEPGGYPRLPAGWTPSLLSRIVSIADCFISLQNRLSGRVPGVSPAEALAKVLGPLAARFEPALRWALVKSVGFYPPGQLVELDDGALAVVLAPSTADPARPHVRILIAPNGAPVAAGHRFELRPIPPDRSVRRALRLAEYPPDLDAAAMSDDGGDTRAA